MTTTTTEKRPIEETYFADNIRKWRKSMNYTQEHVAQLIAHERGEKVNAKNISKIKRTYQNWENKRTMPKYSDIIILQKIIGCSYDFFFEVNGICKE